MKDSIKEVLGDAIGFSNREENLNLSNASIKLMQLILSEFAKLNKDIILESNFHKEELESLCRIAFESNYELLILVLRGNIEILHKRYLNRIYNENRHFVHLSIRLDALEDFQNSIERSRMEKISGNTSFESKSTIIYINADDFCYQTDEDVLSKIDKFIEG